MGVKKETSIGWRIVEGCMIVVNLFLLFILGSFISHSYVSETQNFWVIGGITLAFFIFAVIVVIIKKQKISVQRVWAFTVVIQLLVTFAGSLTEALMLFVFNAKKVGSLSFKQFDQIVITMAVGLFISIFLVITVLKIDE